MGQQQDEMILPIPVGDYHSYLKAERTRQMAVAEVIHYTMILRTNWIYRMGSHRHILIILLMHGTQFCGHMKTTKYPKWE